MTNADQRRAWDGEVGEFWTARAERFDQGVARYHHRLLAAAAIRPADRVLDVGCGSGQVTRDAARLADHGSALGVDLSTRQLDLARRTAERDGVVNATFLAADAQTHPFPAGTFDLVLSRHGALFFDDPVAAFTNLASATRSGGRLVLLSWQDVERNEWLTAIRAALAAGRTPTPQPAPTPGTLRDPDQIRWLLDTAGFTDVQVDPVAEPMYFGADVDDAYRFLAGQHAAALDRLDAADRDRATTALRAGLAAHETGDGVYYGSAGWLVTARRP